MHEYPPFFDATFHYFIKIQKKPGNIFGLAIHQRVDDMLESRVVLEMFEMGSGCDDWMVE